MNSIQGYDHDARIKLSKSTDDPNITITLKSMI